MKVTQNLPTDSLTCAAANAMLKIMLAIDSTSMNVCTYIHACVYIHMYSVYKQYERQQPPLKYYIYVCICVYKSLGMMATAGGGWYLWRLLLLLLLLRMIPRAHSKWMNDWFSRSYISMSICTCIQVYICWYICLSSRLIVWSSAWSH